MNRATLSGTDKIRIARRDTELRNNKDRVADRRDRSAQANPGPPAHRTVHWDTGSHISRRAGDHSRVVGRRLEAIRVHNPGR